MNYKITLRVCNTSQRATEVVLGGLVPGVLVLELKLELLGGWGPATLTGAVGADGATLGGCAGGGGGGGGGAGFCVIEDNGYALASVPKIERASGR